MNGYTCIEKLGDNLGVDENGHLLYYVSDRDGRGEYSLEIDGTSYTFIEDACVIGLIHENWRSYDTHQEVVE